MKKDTTLGKEFYTATEVSKLTGFSRQLIIYYMKNHKISCKIEDNIRYTHRVDVDMLMRGIKPPPRQGCYTIVPSEIKFYDRYIGVVASNTNNEFLFDLVAFPDIRLYRWNENGAGYLGTTINNESVFAHHLIFGKPENGFVTDHIDLDRKNCRSSNIRFVTVAENGANAKLSSRNTSGYKGVTWDRSKGKWKSAIGSHHFIGRYDNIQEAAIAYDNAMIEKYGEYAMTNKKLGLL